MVQKLLTLHDRQEYQAFNKEHVGHHIITRLKLIQLQFKVEHRKITKFQLNVSVKLLCKSQFTSRKAMVVSCAKSFWQHDI